MSSSSEKLLWQRARAAWPELYLGERDFTTAVGRLTDGLPLTEAEAAQVFAEDLFLALACSKGEQRARAIFEARYLPRVRDTVRGVDPSDLFTERVLTRLRDDLYSDDGAGPARLGDYLGRSSLVSWLRVCAVRTALSMRDPRSAANDSMAALLSDVPAQDPELAQVRRERAMGYALALQDALEVLSERERTLLLWHSGEGLDIDEVGHLFQVHRATAARWLISARKRLQMEMRKRLLREVDLQQAAGQAPLVRLLRGT
jgi:RNA polymerase sigma-70 factor (ECF subfamily)